MSASLDMELGDFLKFVGDYCRRSEAAWSVITALRGPDSPSERPNHSHAKSSELYWLRRERKRRTVEVIRGKAVGQVGAARTRKADSITLPPSSCWDHFDKHCARAANVLGLHINIDASLEVKE